MMTYRSRAVFKAFALCLGLASSLCAQQSVLTLAYQLTHVGQDEPYPSPDGKKLVYETIVAGHQQIFVMNLDASGQIQITNDPITHDSPLWSPDGNWIAFVAEDEKHETICIMKPDGSGRECLTGPEHKFIHPNWSPDSRSLIFCSDDDLEPPKKNASEIYTFDLKTKKLTQIISGGTNTYPVLSPDGKKIAFRRILGEMNSEVFVADADGSNQKNLTNHPAFDGWPSWSPDGKQIVFASNRRSAYQVFVMNADGGDVRLVANTDGRATEPRWSPDGKRIYFSNCRPVDFGYDCEVMVAVLGQVPKPSK